MLRKTPAQIGRWLDENLHRFDNPAAYLGGEPNTRQWSEEQWSQADLRVIIVAPFDYLQAVGNTTVPLLYQLANSRKYPQRVVERAYFPTSRREFDLLHKASMPLWGLETRHAITDYDVVAIPINYPPYWFNSVQVLHAAQIPVLQRDRMPMREPYPLIMVGGHSYASPWFMSPVIDLAWAGEAEDEVNNPGWNAFLDTVAHARAQGALYTSAGREEFLHQSTIQFPNIFVPSHYTLQHEQRERPDELVDDRHPKKYWVTTGWTTKYKDTPQRVTKRIVHHLDNVISSTRPPVPFIDPGMGMGTVQAARGCGYHCSFCAASYREAPYRERSQGVLYAQLQENMKHTGADQVSPLTLEFGTYTRKKALMKQVIENLTDNFSMPSLRVDVFSADPVFGQLAVHAQKSNITIAIEGNSQRLREIVSKGIQEEDILRAFSNAIAAGYQTAKIYMICDLPGEGPEDHEELVQLCQRLDTLRRSVGSKMKVRLSWKPLTVQAWTPFQWLPARNWSASLGGILKRIQEVGFGTQIGDESRSSLGDYIQVAELADDVAGEAITDLILTSGAITYGVLPRATHDQLIKSLAKYGRTLEDYFREKDYPDEVFPWDVMDPLISKEYLVRHYARVKARLALPSGEVPTLYGKGFLERFGACTIGCTQCGACDPDSLADMWETARRTDEPVKLADLKSIDRHTVRQKVLLHVNIAPRMRFATKEFWTYAIRRAAYLADLPIATDSIRFATDRILTMKPWYAGHDYVELGFVRPQSIAGLPANLNQELVPFGMTILTAGELGVKESITARNLDAMLWELEVDLPTTQLTEICRTAWDDPKAVIKYHTERYRAGEVIESILVKDAIHDIFVHSRGRHTTLIMVLDPNVSPYDAANALIGRRADAYRYPALLRAAITQLWQTPDAFTQFCTKCQKPIPNDWDHPIDDKYCIRHYYEYGVTNATRA